MDGYVTIGTELDTSGIDSGLSSLESKLNKRGRKIGQVFSGGFLIGFSLLTSVISKMIEGFINSMDSAISRVDTMNNFSNVMANLGQSAEDSQQAIDYMSEKLQGLPTALDQGVSAVQRFTSANNDVKASTQMFLALNNAILAGGAPMEQQRSALEQLSQAYAKGKPDMMEWRTTMSTMPAQMTQVAKAMGFVNANALGEALRSGTVSMNDFMKTLVQMNNASVNDFKSFEEQARTATGGIQTQIANLKTAFTRGTAEIIQSIGQANITAFFQTIISAIKASIPYISAFVKSFVVAVTFIGKAIRAIAGAIGSLFGKKGKSGAKEMSTDVATASVNMGKLGTGAGNVSKSLGKASKSAKELKKQLAGFDEMNVLQDNTSASGGGGGASSGGADVGGLGDLGSMGDIGDLGLGKLKDTIKELNPLTDLFTGAMWGLVGALGGLKLGLDPIKSLGLGAILSGIYFFVDGITKYLQDPSWANFLEILGGIALIVGGIALVLGPTQAIIAGIVLLIVAIGLAVYKNWDKIKAVLSKVGNWIKDNIIDPVVNFFKELWEKIKEVFAPVIEFFKPIIQTIKDIIKVLIETIINYVKTVVTNIKTTIDNIKQIVGIIVSFMKEKIINPIIDKIATTISTIKSKISAFVTAIKNYFSPLINFFSNIINKIKGFLVKIGTAVGNTIAGAFKGVVNGILNAIEKILNFPINAVNKLIKKVNTLPGVNLTKLSTFKFPRLAKGGIVNNPGPGVMVGNAIAGERGAEGVIPLTDSQQMALLGEAIGKYITINANITNSMNGRVISRELQKIQNDDNFAYNR